MHFIASGSSGTEIILRYAYLFYTGVKFMNRVNLMHFAVGMMILSGVAAFAAGDRVTEPTNDPRRVELSQDVLFENGIGYYAANGALSKEDAFEEANDRAETLCRMFGGDTWLNRGYVIARSKRMKGSRTVYRLVIPKPGGTLSGREPAKTNLGLTVLEHFEFKQVTCGVPPTPTPAAAN